MDTVPLPQSVPVSAEECLHDRDECPVGSNATALQTRLKRQHTADSTTASQKSSVFATACSVTSRAATAILEVGQSEDAPEKPGLTQSIALFFYSQWLYLSSTVSAALFAHLALLGAWNVVVLLMHKGLCNDEIVPPECEKLIGASKQTIQLMSVVLTFLIIFFKNEAYSRWWEARCCWGALIKHAIEISQLASTYIPDANLAERVLRHTIVYAFAVKQMLREEPLLFSELRGAITYKEFTAIENIEGWNAIHSLDVCRACIAKALEDQALNPLTLSVAQAFEQQISSMWACAGACLRLRYTSIPTSHKGYMVISTWIFLLLLPLSVVSDIGWYAIVVSGLMTWLLVGNSNAGTAMQEPFGYDPEDLPLQAYCEALRVQCCCVFLRVHGKREQLLGLSTNPEDKSFTETIRQQLTDSNTEGLLRKSKRFSVSLSESLSGRVRGSVLLT